MHTYTTNPDDFPAPWVTGWGEDEYGLWMAFNYKGVRYTFRWCDPGSFLMGSPEEEPERLDNENQHQVTLSKGFWLGETPVTQALWEIIMGDNPSEFKGEELPVDSVSWEDTIRFIDKLNGVKPELHLCLPTEAQWEYACRAGTETPFFFGDNITTEQVNYDGTEPYNNGKRGEFRQRTVEVKELLPNDWGFYQMHGNISEWCADWYRMYLSGPVTDPSGPESGDKRVLRGGSWFGDGGYCRSAYRNHSHPYSRYLIGFRLARSHG